MYGKFANLSQTSSLVTNMPGRSAASPSGIGIDAKSEIHAELLQRVVDKIKRNTIAPAFSLFHAFGQRPQNSYRTPGSKLLSLLDGEYCPKMIWLTIACS